MELYLHNTLTKERELFEPKDPNRVTFYTCGVTVYDSCHLGHARAYVVFDTIRRSLEHAGYGVHYIQNFTDIDDKIINRANEKGISVDALTEQYIGEYFEDMDKLNIKRADQYPKATEYIDSIIKVISGLIEKGHAYEVDGDVYFEVATYADYGKLSKKVLDDLEAGNRVDVDTRKRHAFDFALWKKAKSGEPDWDSPWSKGRPGWHIECSAMVLDVLGQSIDIHAGGEDLVFPHHENEIAQSECYSGCQPFAKYWLHNGFLTINDEKMSKSEGNFFTLRETLEKIDGDSLRFYLLRVHYRTHLNFTFDGLEESKVSLEKLKECISNNPEFMADDQFAPFENRFKLAVANDFNFAEAIGVCFELRSECNRLGSGGPQLLDLLQQLGVLLNFDPFAVEDLDSIIQDLVDQRQEARANRDFAKADEIRDTLLNDHGIVLEDTPVGVRWKRS